MSRYQESYVLMIKREKERKREREQERERKIHTYSWEVDIKNQFWYGYGLIFKDTPTGELKVVPSTSFFFSSADGT